jgi:hypothetical protein
MHLFVLYMVNPLRLSGPPLEGFTERSGRSASTCIHSEQISFELFMVNNLINNARLFVDKKQQPVR